MDSHSERSIPTEAINATEEYQLPPVYRSITAAPVMLESSFVGHDSLFENDSSILSGPVDFGKNTASSILPSLSGASFVLDSPASKLPAFLKEDTSLVCAAAISTVRAAVATALKSFGVAASYDDQTAQFSCALSGRCDKQDAGPLGLLTLAEQQCEFDVNLYIVSHDVIVEFDLASGCRYGFASAFQAVHTQLCKSHISSTKFCDAHLKLPQTPPCGICLTDDQPEFELL